MPKKSARFEVEPEKIAEPVELAIYHFQASNSEAIDVAANFAEAHGVIFEPEKNGQGITREDFNNAIARISDQAIGEMSTSRFHIPVKPYGEMVVYTAETALHKIAKHPYAKNFQATVGPEHSRGLFDHQAPESWLRCAGAAVISALVIPNPDNR